MLLALTRGTAIITHFFPSSYCILYREERARGKVARLAGVGRRRGESTPPLSTSLDGKLDSRPMLTANWANVDSKLGQY
jgi:hypothetical protein